MGCGRALANIHLAWYWSHLRCMYFGGVRVGARALRAAGHRRQSAPVLLAGFGSAPEPAGLTRVYGRGMGCGCACANIHMAWYWSHLRCMQCGGVCVGVCLMFCIVTVPLVVAQQGRAMRPVLVVMWSDRCFLPPTHWPSSIRSHHRDVVHPPTYIGCCARGVRALTCMAQGTSDAHKHRIIRDTSNSNTSASEQDRSANVGRLNFTSVASSPQYTYTCTCELTILIFTCMHIYLHRNNYAINTAGHVIMIMIYMHMRMHLRARLQLRLIYVRARIRIRVHMHICMRIDL